MNRPADAGVTLVEMLVALALFALIGVAGFGVLDAILRAESRTEGRMTRLESLDTALRLLARDIETGAPDTLRLEDDALSIAATGAETGTILTWRSDDGDLVRRFARAGIEAPMDQAILGDVAAARWQVLDRAGQWSATWSATPEAATQGDAPRGVALDLTLGFGTGPTVELRRLFVLPDTAPPPRRPLGVVPALLDPPAGDGAPGEARP